MADANAEPAKESVWTMGLKGLAGSMANITSTALICIMFYQSQLEMRDQFREEKNLYRESVKRFHEDNAEWRSIIQQQQQAVARVQLSISENQIATSKLTEALNNLARELKTTKEKP